MNHQKRGILVTGSHRSGTTWVGRMLSLPDNVVYIFEPFSLEVSTKVIPYSFQHWFPYIHDLPDSEAFYRAMDQAIHFKYVPPPAPDLPTHRALKSVVKGHLKNALYRSRGHLPLLKDPLALFSAKDLAARYDLDVVCMIRHPLAFCSSLKKWDWKFPFQHLLNQSRLIEHRFQHQAERIEHFATTEQPIVHQAALLWNLFHHVIRAYQQEHPDWHYHRHEDMVVDPVETFESLYQKLGLGFTPHIRGQLNASLSAKSGETSDAGFKARNAKSVTQTWKSRLNDDEINHILGETAELRAHFYPEG